MRDRGAAVLVFVPLVWCLTAAELTISGTRCGDLTCKTHEFCSPFERQCQPCADVCVRESHNFEETRCVKECQGYLHDMRYVQVGQATDNRSFAPSTSNDSSRDIDKLFKLVTTALVLVILLIVVVVAFAAFKIYTWVQDNDIKATNIIGYFKRENNNDDIEKNSPNGISSNASTATTPRRDIANQPKDLRLNLSRTVSNSEQPTTPATMTTSISRRPAEDSALDYAYDNHGMAGTPSPHSGKSPRESNF